MGDEGNHRETAGGIANTHDTPRLDASAEAVRQFTPEATHCRKAVSATPNPGRCTSPILASHARQWLDWL